MTLADQLKEKRVILASASPRRKQLLQGLDITFESRSLGNHSEEFPQHLKKNEIAEFLALSKAEHYCKVNLVSENDIIITADTIVWLNDRVLNKPSDQSDAYKMLKELSGRTHEVYTGVCITYKEAKILFSSLSVVEFAELNDDEINYYIGKYKPYDKAGSYGAQEWIGYIAIKRIEGSFFNVMGLPIRMVYDELKKLMLTHAH